MGVDIALRHLFQHSHPLPPEAHLFSFRYTANWNFEIRCLPPFRKRRERMGTQATAIKDC